MKINLTILLLAAAGLLISSSFTTAQTTVYPVADAYVMAGQPTANFGTAAGGDGLRVRVTNTGSALPDSLNRWVYIKFDLTGFVGSINNASLSVWLDRAISSKRRDTSECYAVSDDEWLETDINWSNKPSIGSVLFAQKFDWRNSALDDTMYTWDVTSYVQSEYAGNKVVTFCFAELDTVQETDLRIFSRESPDGTTPPGQRKPFLTINTPTGISEGPESMPAQLSLCQNYPNPFNPVTNIVYSVVSQEHVKLEVFDMQGRSISVPVDGIVTPGIHTVPFSAENLASGVYYYTLTSGQQKISRLMVVLK